jgi:cell division protein FtsW
MKTSENNLSRFVNNLTNPSSQTSQSVGSGTRKRKTQLWFDTGLLLVVITLLIFGIVMVYSASYDFSLQIYGDPSLIFFRQLRSLVIGLAAAVFLAFFDYHHWKRFAVVALGVTVLLLLAVFGVNEVRNGAVRTLLGGSVQPSELAKFVLIIYLAVWLSSKKEILDKVSFGLIPLAGILGFIGGLILLQPDFSAVITIIIIGGLMFFLAGGDWKQIILLAVVGTLIGAGIIFVSHTGSKRMVEFWAGIWDPTASSYHVKRSLEALIRGGWIGVGIGEAETKLTGLPVPPTDSIFAVVGEETGLFGVFSLITLYSLLFWRGMKIAKEAPDQLGSLIAAGLVIWITVEAFVNMSVMVSILPFAGNALPFISAGGSNLVMSLAAVGTLFNVSRITRMSKEEKGIANEVVDLRGRDRRRRVSRNSRVAQNQSQ